MSAATMIACACDEIIMGKHSALGPIDPQITFDSFTSPAQSILDEFEMAKREITINPALAAIWMKRIEKYPTGFIQICKNTIELSKERLTLWLMTWMLKDIPDKETIANEVAQWLGTTNIHKTHGKPIDINELNHFKLNVTPLEMDQELQERVLSVFHATMATHDFSQCVKIIENHNGLGHFISAKR